MDDFPEAGEPLFEEAECDDDESTRFRGGEEPVHELRDQIFEPFFPRLFGQVRNNAHDFLVNLLVISDNASKSNENDSHKSSEV